MMWEERVKKTFLSEEVIFSLDRVNSAEASTVQPLRMVAGWSVLVAGQAGAAGFHIIAESTQ